MPLVDIQLIEGVFDKSQKQEMIRKVTDVMVEIEGEAMRGVTWGPCARSCQRTMGHRRQGVDDRRHQGTPEPGSLIASALGRPKTRPALPAVSRRPVFHPPSGISKKQLQTLDRRQRLWISFHVVSAPGLFPESQGRSCSLARLRCACRVRNGV
jgi:hypothetical protein